MTDELKAQITRLEARNADLREEIDELREELENERDYSDVQSALRAGRIEDALWELEKALPDEFIGFADTIIRWRRPA